MRAEIVFLAAQEYFREHTEQSFVFCGGVDVVGIRAAECLTIPHEPIPRDAPLNLVDDLSSTREGTQEIYSVQQDASHNAEGNSDELPVFIARLQPFIGEALKFGLVEILVKGLAPAFKSLNPDWIHGKEIDALSFASQRPRENLLSLVGREVHVGKINRNHLDFSLM
jgi:hypothetical protein